MDDPAKPPAVVRRGGTVRRLAAVVVALGLGSGLVVTGLGFGLYRYSQGLPPIDVSPADVRSVTVVDREGRLLRPFTTDDGRWRLPVKVAEVDPAYVRMLLAYEDNRFRSHIGIDAYAFIRAGWQLLSQGRIVSGGSTITMQVARLLEPREERSFGAKARQAVRALELERRFSKDEILSLYLSLAPFGGNIEGLRAASLAYFGKEPRRLSQAESALLVALPQSPEVRRPDRRPALARAARDRVLDRAFERGVVNVAELTHAKDETMPSGRLSFPIAAAHVAEELVAEKPLLMVHRSTLDYKLQTAIEAMVRDRVALMGARLSAAVLVIDNVTGEVRAHIGGADYFSADRAGAVDLARAFRSPGSALKPFIYAMAFENGQAHPETILEDRPARYGAWAPENFDQSFHGLVTARVALQQSLNVPAVELLDIVGPARLAARMKAAGADLLIPKDSAPGLAIGLGGLGIKLTDLARLYTGLARGGETIALRWRKDDAGDTAKPPETLRLVDPVSAWYVADILRGAPPPLNALPGRLAYKTGTSYGYRDAWAVGFDRRWTVAVWVGRPDGAPVPGLVGRLVAAPILFDAYQRIGTEPEFIQQPRDAILATSASLPPPLRHIRRDLPKTLAAATATAQLAISYPPDGARIDLGLLAKGIVSDSGPLALKALGGVPPLTWLVNGVPVVTAEPRRTDSWQPDGAGFAQVSVIDSRGTTASVRIRLE